MPTKWDAFDLIAASYEFTVRADGHGTTRATMQVKAGQGPDLSVQVRVDRASAHVGATTTGDGLYVDKLIDDTEATNWAAPLLGAAPVRPVGMHQRSGRGLRGRGVRPVRPANNPTSSQM